MPKPACVKCQRFYRVHSNGVRVLEQMPTHSTALPGTAEAQNWKPYKVWLADHWRCEGCGHDLITGYGGKPLHEHYEDGFNEYLEKTHMRATINDC